MWPFSMPKISPGRASPRLPCCHGTFDAIQQHLAQTIAGTAIQHCPRGVVRVLTFGTRGWKVAGEILVFLSKGGTSKWVTCVSNGDVT